MQHCRISNFMSRRNTQTQSDILDLLKSTDSALSHDMIQEKFESVNRATIYRVLNRFCEDGIVHRIVGDDGKQYFALCINCKGNKHQDDHFHFRCTQCGKMECLHAKVSVVLPSGYHFEHFNGVITGLCNHCN